MINICVISLDDKNRYNLSLPCSEDKIQDITKQIGDSYKIIGINNPKGLIIDSFDKLHELNQGAKLVEEFHSKELFLAYLEYKSCELIWICSVLDQVEFFHLYEDVYNYNELFDYIYDEKIFDDEIADFFIEYLDKEKLVKDWICSNYSEYAFTSYGFLKRNK